MNIHLSSRITSSRRMTLICSTSRHNYSLTNVRDQQYSHFPHGRLTDPGILRNCLALLIWLKLLNGKLSSITTSDPINIAQCTIGPVHESRLRLEHTSVRATADEADNRILLGNLDSLCQSACTNNAKRRNLCPCELDKRPLGTAVELGLGAFRRCCLACVVLSS